MTVAEAGRVPVRTIVVPNGKAAGAHVPHRTVMRDAARTLGSSRTAPAARARRVCGRRESARGAPQRGSGDRLALDSSSPAQGRCAGAVRTSAARSSRARW